MMQVSVALARHQAHVLELAHCRRSTISTKYAW
jgi:hypothetical protein